MMSTAVVKCVVLVRDAISIRVQVEIMGSQKCRIEGNLSQFF
jgi:hypothetical protein